MDVFITYSKYNLKCLSALISGCSKNVRLIESSDINHLSMSPTCEDVKNPSSIICFILNIDPFNETLYDDLFFIEKYVKPKLYNYYRCGQNSKDKKMISEIEIVLDKLFERFKSVFASNNIGIYEIILWSELYLILDDRFKFDKVKIPENIITWFKNLFKLKPFKTAVDLVFGEINDKTIKDIIANIPNLQVYDLFTEQINESNILTKPNMDYNDTVTHFLDGCNHLTTAPTYNTPKLPLKNHKNILITSALPYVNNVPHLGNLIGSTLSADFYSRYCKLRGWNSIYICGTDEYGTATEVKAALEGCSPREICDKYYKIHSDVYNWFNIEFDIFGRTSDKGHVGIVQQMFQDVKQNGYIIEDSVHQLLCEKCNRYLADRFVEGVCPNCSFEDARGDQCDGCGKLINATELKKPRCKMCSNQPVIKESQHLFLELGKLKSSLEQYMLDRQHTWSTSAKGITKSWLTEELRPRCITRDLKWGVPVPQKDFESKVFYVWFDAVLGYLSITSKYTDQWQKWWLKNDDYPVTLVQFMAKDNVPFHSIIFPAILIASNKHYIVPDTIAATEYLNYESTKFSKSRGIGVFGNDIMELEKSTTTTTNDGDINVVFNSDLWRFYLAVSRPESQDSSFLWDDFVTRLNSELLNNLGNFVNRSFSFLINKFQGIIPINWSEQIHIDEDGSLIDFVNEELGRYCEYMDTMRIRDAVATVLSISRQGNIYLQQHAPWKLLKLGDEISISRAATVISIAANVALLLGTLLLPIMPYHGNWIHEQCQAPKEARWLPSNPKLVAWLEAGHKMGLVKPMFIKIESEDFVKKMRAKFG